MMILVKLLELGDVLIQHLSFFCKAVALVMAGELLRGIYFLSLLLHSYSHLVFIVYTQVVASPSRWRCSHYIFLYYTYIRYILQ
jgi:hypothetical protein